MNRNLLVLNAQALRNNRDAWRCITRKHLVPLLAGETLVDDATEYTFRYLRLDGTIFAPAETYSIGSYKGKRGIRIPGPIQANFRKNLEQAAYLFVSVEGVSSALTVIVVLVDSKTRCFSDISKHHETLRLEAFDLPPIESALVTSPEVRDALYQWLGSTYRHLFSVNAHQFLNSTHILESLFGHIGSISSSESISFIDKVRVLGDHFTSWMEPRIKKIEKNHQELWGSLFGERVSFLDGGMSKLIGLPSVEPMGIRVGTYTVIPGEENPEQREAWSMDSLVIGDVLSDRSLIEDLDYRTDNKRLQEAARYLLEPLSLLNHSNMRPPPCIGLLHGPLQNQFQQYDELSPSYIPGLNKDFLAQRGISRSDILEDLKDIPTIRGNVCLWNSAIPIYVYIMRRISEVKIPLLGVVERAASKSILETSLNDLVEEGIIPERTRRKVRKVIAELDLDDQLVFGCVLEEGEYIEPLRIVKNRPHRANDRWRPIMTEIPPIFGTMLKCTEHAFPFRTEFNRLFDPKKTHEVMKLVYHTSLLLPRYAFPVGIDIVDKYAKIPDWMSKGISSHLAASIFRYCLQKGDVKTLMRMRTILSRSPRDFFYRPKA